MSAARQTITPAMIERCQQLAKAGVVLTRASSVSSTVQTIGMPAMTHGMSDRMQAAGLLSWHVLPMGGGAQRAHLTDAGRAAAATADAAALRRRAMAVYPSTLP